MYVCFTRLAYKIQMIHIQKLAIRKDSDISATLYETVVSRRYEWKRSKTATAGSPTSLRKRQRIRIIVKAQGKVRKSPQKHSMAADGLLGLHHLVKRRPISLSPFKCMIL